jgi:hypothetical protein
MQTQFIVDTDGYKKYELAFILFRWDFDLRLDISFRIGTSGELLWTR